jgi:peptide/nickel transport system permease protein
MVGYVITRFAQALVVLLGVVSVTFVLMHLAGDPVAGLIPPGASPEIQAQIREAHGLNRPLPQQYLVFVAGAMRGDFGDSWRQDRPALQVVLERLPATIALTAAAIALAALVGGTLGIVAADRQGSAWDAGARLLALAGQAIPAFWLGTMLILVFAVALRWLPSSGLNEPAGIVLPAVALAAYPAATLTRLVRVSLIEALSADYIRTARAKGLSRRAILIGHALRNAALPALAFAGLQAGFLFGGAVIVEGVFALPGIGGLALDAAFTRDIPLVEAFVWTVAVLILGTNLATGLLATAIDPRLREGDRLMGSGA